MAGDAVVIARRFFINHALPQREHGVGIVKELDGAYIFVAFAAHQDFQKYIELEYLGEIDVKGPVMIIKIHSVYLEKVRLKSHGKKKQNKDSVPRSSL